MKNLVKMHRVKKSLKVCSLTKLKTLTSSIHLNRELSKLCELTVIDWPYYTKLSALFAPLKSISKLHKALKEHDILHVQYDIAGYMPLFLPLLWLLSIANRKSAKIVLSLHEKYDNAPLSRVVIAFHNLFYTTADELLVHTGEHKEFLARHLHSRTFVIPHGVIEAKNVKHNFDSNTLLLAGYINKWKGHDLAIRAMSLVLKEIPDAKLLILSRPNDLKYEEDVRKMVIELELETNVEFNDKKIEEAQMFKYFDNTAISLLPYRRVTMSGILSHTISRHVPAILSDLPAFREVMKNKGLFFRVNDYEDLAVKIIYLLKNKKLQKKMSEGFAKLAEDYSWKNIAKETLEAYKKCLA